MILQAGWSQTERCVSRQAAVCLAGGSSPPFFLPSAAAADAVPLALARNNPAKPFFSASSLFGHRFRVVVRGGVEVSLFRNTMGWDAIQRTRGVLSFKGYLTDQRCQHILGWGLASTSEHTGYPLDQRCRRIF